MEILKNYALSFLGTPYKWAGSFPGVGIDCSGLVLELLKSVGEAPPGDTTAQGIFNYLSENGRATYDTSGLGTVVFFGASVTAITHVGLMLDNYRFIEAGGGGSSVNTLDDAIKKEAYVRIRLLTNRKDLVGSLKPRYNKIGYF